MMPTAEREIPDCAQLVELLGSADRGAREAAAAALLAPDKDCVHALADGMNHSSQRVRAACAGLMDHLADSRCVRPLIQALSDPAPRVRRLAVHSLGCQECKTAPLPVDVVQLLIDCVLYDSSIRVRRVAAHQLGLQPYDPRAVAALQQVLDRDSDCKLRSRTQFALQNQSKRGQIKL